MEGEEWTVESERWVIQWEVGGKGWEGVRGMWWAEGIGGSNKNLIVWTKRVSKHVSVVPKLRGTV